MLNIITFTILADWDRWKIRVFKLQKEAILSTLTLDIFKSTEIEDEALNKDPV